MVFHTYRVITHILTYFPYLMAFFKFKSTTATNLSRNEQKRLAILNEELYGSVAQVAQKLQANSVLGVL